MDNPTTLIVSIMYVTILSLGLANLLMALSDLVGGNKALPDRVHLSWLVLLLFAYFGFFWQTKLILDIDNWLFLPFVFFLAGPVSLLFGTNLLTNLPENEQTDSVAHYLSISRRVFLLIALFYAWIVGLDTVSGDIDKGTLVPGAFCIVSLILMLSANYQLHKLGAILGWVLLLVGFVFDIL